MYVFIRVEITQNTLQRLIILLISYMKACHCLQLQRISHDSLTLNPPVCFDLQQSVKSSHPETLLRQHFTALYRSIFSYIEVTLKKWVNETFGTGHPYTYSRGGVCQPGPIVDRVEGQYISERDRPFRFSPIPVQSVEAFVSKRVFSPCAIYIACFSGIGMVRVSSTD